ncbi:putative ATP-dependent RNA helicase DHX33 isoform X2 [Ceratitis capitata]|uniref:putative ATP-dependent RNA helicase DHX33 isoform X2 n=1 Tax=Ceratitis capitata TaxID=7213 RepID=UPI0006187E58|nr:putative ATP-dependent RNA helicase DHX33 isoform X2 [Ceratitis capitata]
MSSAMESKYLLTSKNSVKSAHGGITKNNVNISSFPIKRKLQSPVNGVENVLIKTPKLNNGSSPSTSNGKTNTGTLTPNGSLAHLNGKGVQSKQQLEQQRQALPVYKVRQRIIQEARRNETMLLMGETGSGKTTQIPQFLYESGFAQKGMIGITQPRRVAAITVARRVALEQGCRLGETVGYTVRFEDCTSPQTRIRFLTDGCLLREAIADRLLRQYTVIMLDEAHERTINTDVLFGIVKEAQKQRRTRGLTPLKVIVTSATMDIDHFGKYFNVRGMYLEGKTYPVKVMHVKETQPDYLHSALVTLFQLHRSDPINHDVLIFLTGQEEIEAMAQQIRQIAKTHDNELHPVRVFPLYAQLPQNKQLECFLPAPSNARKIVLATNIAETSVTIPGIRCIIDCGFVKQRVYNPNTGLDALRIVRVSQAQAWQRCGRAGRDAPGTCYRTYTQAEMESFENMPKPEILRSNICSTVLQLLALGIDCRTFDFLDRPTPEAVDDAYRKLEALGAVRNPKTKPELTTLGQEMTQFPLDPRYSKLLLSASAFGCMEEMLSLVAVLSGENVFISSNEKRELATLAHAKFTSKYGDHLTLLNVFSAFLKTEKVKLWCHDNFLNTRNLTYAREVRKQLEEIVERLDLPLNSCGNNHDQVRKCLLIGLFDNIAELQRDNTYLTIAGRQRARIHPSSVFHGKYRPEYVIFTEIVLTERNFLRQVTEINPDWIADVLPNYAHLNRIKSTLK